MESDKPSKFFIDTGVLFIFVGFIIFWELVSYFFGIPTYLLPKPSVIIQALIVNFGTLFTDFWVTFLESLLGLIIGSLTGFIFAVIIVHSKFMERTVYPVLISTQAIPIVAIAPLLIIWFGYGLAGKVVMAVLICFFPTTANTTAGLSSINKTSLDFMKTLRANKWQIFLKLRLPASMPYFFVGLKTSAALSVIGAIVAELAGAKSGLGFRIVVASSRLETPLVFATIILSSLLGIFFYYGVDKIGKKLLNKKHLL